MSSKKRKRESVDATLQISAHSSPQLGPVLGRSQVLKWKFENFRLKCSWSKVTFPALEPPKSIPYKCYLRAAPRDERSDEDGPQEEDFASQDTLVVGEGDTVEFSTSDESKEAVVGCRFVFKPAFRI